MGEWGYKIKNLNRSTKMIFYSNERYFTKGEHIKYSPRGRCAVITCFLKGAVEESVSNCSVGEHFLKGVMLQLTFEGQIGIKEVKVVGLGGNPPGRENGMSKSVYSQRCVC